MDKPLSKNELETSFKEPAPNPSPDNTFKVYFWLIVCSMMMFTLPFGAFFVVKHILHDTFHIDGFANTCWSTLAAVICVNLIICFYAYLGYLEDKHDHPPKYEKIEKKKQ